MNNVGLLQRFPSTRSPCPGPGCSPASPRAGAAQLAALPGPFPLHECHLVGPPGASPASRSAGHLPQHSPGSARPHTGENRTELTTICISDNGKSRDKCRKKNYVCLEGRGWLSSFPHTPFWLREGFGNCSTYLGDFFRSLLKVLHSPTVKSYCAARIHFFEWHLFGRRTVEWLRVSRLKNMKHTVTVRHGTDPRIYLCPHQQL